MNGLLLGGQDPKPQKEKKAKKAQKPKADTAAAKDAVEPAAEASTEATPNPEGVGKKYRCVRI